MRHGVCYSLNQNGTKDVLYSLSYIIYIKVLCICLLFITAYELSTLDDPLCADCVMHHGVCYSLNQNGTKDGCQCPTTLSGDDCEVSHGKKDITLYYNTFWFGLDIMQDIFNV